MKTWKLFCIQILSGLKVVSIKKLRCSQQKKMKPETWNLKFKFDLMGEKKFGNGSKLSHTREIGVHNLFLIILNPLSVYVLYAFMLLPLYAFSDI